MIVGKNDVIQGQHAGIGTVSGHSRQDPRERACYCLSSIRPNRRCDAGDVRQVNATARSVSAQRRRCRPMDTLAALTLDGEPLPAVLLDDHVHLTPAGYRVWMEALRTAVGAAS